MTKTMTKTIVSPIGTANYPFLNVPDTKFKPEGEYKVKLILEDDEETRAFIDQIYDYEAQYLEEAQVSAGKKKIRTADSCVKELEDGRFEITPKLRAKVETRAGSSFTQKPVIIDANKKEWDQEQIVTYNSKIRVKVEFVPYSTPVVGVSLRLKAVQVIELAELSSNAANDFDVVSTNNIEDAVSEEADF